MIFLRVLVTFLYFKMHTCSKSIAAFYQQIFLDFDLMYNKQKLQQCIITRCLSFIIISRLRHHQKLSTIGKTKVRALRWIFIRYHQYCNNRSWRKISILSILYHFISKMCQPLTECIGKM